MADTSLLSEADSPSLVETVPDVVGEKKEAPEASDGDAKGENEMDASTIHTTMISNSSSTDADTDADNLNDSVDIAVTDTDTENGHLNSDDTGEDDSEKAQPIPLDTSNSPSSNGDNSTDRSDIDNTTPGDEVQQEEKKEEERLDDSFSVVTASATVDPVDGEEDDQEQKDMSVNLLDISEEATNADKQSLDEEFSSNNITGNEVKTTPSETEAGAEEENPKDTNVSEINGDTDAAQIEPQPTVALTPVTAAADISELSAQDESILVELQASLQHQMTLRAEVENKLRNQAVEIDQYKERLNHYSDLEDSLEHANVNLQQVIAEKTNLEQEVGKLRDGRDDLERKEALLSNRLNNAKKKEANKTSAAGRLERENEELKEELSKVQKSLKTVTAQKEKVEHSMEKLKKKCVERVKMTEVALVEERNLNEERKKKMKVFVETKAEELRSVKTTNDEMRTELKETRNALRTVREKLERMTQNFENASMKNREVTREMNRMKKNAEQMHQMGDNLELELHKSAQETEEHKNKRLTAKHELMTILRKLEAEQAVSSKLRDSVKFTFTPKALSQQELMNESLQDLESELFKLARRLGKTLLPSSHSTAMAYGGEGSNNEDNQNSGVEGDQVENGGAGRKKANSRSEWDTTRLLSTLEDETQQVSKSIMAFSGSVERLRGLLDDSGEKTCADTLNQIFSSIAAARNDGATPVPTKVGSFDEDEDGSFL